MKLIQCHINVGATSWRLNNVACINVDATSRCLCNFALMMHRLIMRRSINVMCPLAVDRIIMVVGGFCRKGCTKGSCCPWSENIEQCSFQPSFIKKKISETRLFQQAQHRNNFLSTSFKCHVDIDVTSAVLRVSVNMFNNKTNGLKKSDRE